MAATYDERLKKELFQVEELLNEELFQDSDTFNDLVRPLIAAGGKRLRAKLCLLIAGNTAPQAVHRIAISSAIEMLHLATLIHDDVLDQANLRRGVETIHCSKGNKVAILSGDYLFAKTFAMISRTKNIECLQIFTRVIIALVEGEFFQMEDIGSLGQTKERYLLKIQKKTADFIEAASELGAVLGGYNKYDINLFRDFGHAVGMLFQITDDIMDYRGKEEETGKPVGKDLREGVVTFPILAVTTAENMEALQKELDNVMKGEDPSYLLQYVKENGGIEATLALAAEYGDKATVALDKLPSFEGKDRLYQIVTELIARHI